MNAEQVVEEMTARMNGVREKVRKEHGDVAVNDIEVKWRNAVRSLEEIQSGKTEVSADVKLAIEAEIVSVENIFLN